jgi:hypothetical protein
VNKKKQKNFIRFGSVSKPRALATRQIDEVFLLFFVHKKKILSFA